MKDNFSKQAVQYSKFRPQYPDEMIAHLISFVRNKTTALDVATGNGQLARKLSHFFETVYATDISETQLENAVKADNIIYKKESAENTAFADQQFDLITVAQGIHWFNFNLFYKEVYRILKPDGIFAVLGYGLLHSNPDSDRIILDFYNRITGPYWDPERKYLDENYETIPFPFEELETKNFHNELVWSFDQLIGYLQTWSATQHYIEQNNQNPIDLIYDDLKSSWEKGDKKVFFPLLLRIGKLRSAAPLFNFVHL